MNDTTSNRNITVKVYKIQMPDCALPELWLHILEGSHDHEMDFDKAWTEYEGKEQLQFFFSRDILDARKLTNALVEEIKDE